MKYTFLFILLLGGLLACKTDNAKDQNTTHDDLDTLVATPSVEKQAQIDSLLQNEIEDTALVDMKFSKSGFNDTKYYDLLIETRICNPKYSDTTQDGSTPCSAKYFKFYEYNAKRDVEDAFLLQVRAGVNGYPYRRLLIFVREKGELVLMNGVVGYLVKKIPQDNGIDDLIVAVIDDLGNSKFDRYDVRISYENGKYHFVEAVGDLMGEFTSQKLKEEATKEIYKRIQEKQLIF